MLNRRIFTLSVGATFVWAIRPVSAENAPLLVFAAASLKDVLEEIGAAFLADSGTAIAVSAAGSGQLAKQIEAAAPADLFISADEVWMDWLAERNLIRPETRLNIIGNRLVLIVPESSAVAAAPQLLEQLPQRLGKERLAMADPETVPAGRYARQALTSLKLWDGLSGQIAAAENVRAALQLVARGETPFGIVYESDAKLEKAVRIAATFAADSHDPIVYPAAVIATSARPESKAFLDFLLLEKAQAIFEKAGFQRLPSRS